MVSYNLRIERSINQPSKRAIKRKAKCNIVTLQTSLASTNAPDEGGATVESDDESGCLGSDDEASQATDENTEDDMPSDSQSESDHTSGSADDDNDALPGTRVSLTKGNNTVVACLWDFFHDIDVQLAVC